MVHQPVAPSTSLVVTGSSREWRLSPASAQVEEAQDRQRLHPWLRPLARIHPWRRQPAVALLLQSMDRIHPDVARPAHSTPGAASTRTVRSTAAVGPAASSARPAAGADDACYPAGGSLLAPPDADVPARGGVPCVGPELPRLGIQHHESPSAGRQRLVPRHGRHVPHDLTRWYSLTHLHPTVSLSHFHCCW